MYPKTSPQLNSFTIQNRPPFHPTRIYKYNRSPRKNARLIIKWRTPVSLSDIPTLPDEVSHAIINFTLFYSTMNWLYFRGIRKRIEKKDKNK